MSIHSGNTYARTRGFEHTDVFDLRPAIIDKENARAVPLRYVLTQVFLRFIANQNSTCTFLDKMLDYCYNGTPIIVLKKFRKHFLYARVRHRKEQAVASHAT